MGGAPSTALTRLQTNWVYGALPLALVLFALTPILTKGWTLPDRLVWLSLPVYMLHQYEEHDADRFRLFVDDLLGGPAISAADLFWINILGVWVGLSAVIWLDRAIDPGWGVIAAWLLLLNGLAHLVQALVLRRSNPGVLTAAVLFLPLGLGITTSLGSAATPGQHGIGIAIAILGHAAILLRVRSNLRRSPPP